MRLQGGATGSVFGCAEGEGAPEYLPIDDDYPVWAARPHGMSKRLAEEMCRAWTTRTGIPTVVLRPSGSLETVEYGAFVHVDDVARAAAGAHGGPPPPAPAHPVRRDPFATCLAETPLGWKALRTRERR